MDREQAIEHLHLYGYDAGSDYHDGLDGWFKWTVVEDLLTVSWKPGGPGTDGGDAFTGSWRLVPVEETGQ